MKPVKSLLLVLVVVGFIEFSSQQSVQNRAPVFYTLERDGLDGNLLDTLSGVGLLENVPLGTVIGRLSCYDPDPGDFITRYEAESQTVQVNPITGEVSTIRPLDREISKFNQTELKTTFRCFDNGNNIVQRAFVQTEIVITVQDVNDNAPSFVQLPYRFEVPENTPVGSTVFSGISVIDLDETQNAIVDISCLADDAEKALACDFFALEQRQTGDGRYNASLILFDNLDFETQRGYTYPLFAQDRANGDMNNPVLNRSSNVLIIVLDNQDTPPVFRNVPYTLYVEENSPIDSITTLQIVAIDGDEGAAREIKITIVEDLFGLFRVGDTFPIPNTLNYGARIFVNDIIDREALRGTYSFVVEAIELENGQETEDRTRAIVRVDIQDVNDNIPTFSQDVYTVSLFEIANDQNNFQVPDLSIQVTDLDNPSNSQYRIVIANQSQPTFRVFPANTVIGNVAVNLETVNAGFLDYDNPIYRQQTVILEAREINTDNKIPQTSTATVNIRLKDLNDNSPIFAQENYVFSASEDARIGTIIGVVSANDIDSGLNGAVTYSLSNAGSNQFSINSTTGVITLVEPLDYEDTQRYRILVEARDGGTPARRVSETITVNVLNVNDEGPEPLRTLYKTFAQETNTTLRPTVTLLVKDTEDPTSTITFEIIAGNTPDNAFVVNRFTGEFTLSKTIDFDDSPNRDGIFLVTVRVSDNGNPPQYANINVSVTVQDENNNTPLFGQFLYIANISELAPPDTLVTRVNATDLDGKENGRIRYQIQSGGREHFNINENSGVITVSSKAQFDYEEFPDYTMIVYAIDFGSPPRTGTTTVQVQMLDANNKPPSFTQQIYVLSIREDIPIGTTILTVTALDPDSTRLLNYSIPASSIISRDSGGKEILTQNSIRRAFVVNPTNGVIYTNRTLDRDQAAEVNFNVVAEDLNAETTSKQTATTAVLITILGTDISTIYFTPATYSFTVTEGKGPGYLITTVAARDPACGKCLLQNYYEVPGTDPLQYLQVDRVTGQVTLSRVIDYEVPQSRQLYMEIEAQADDGRTARTSLRVEVKDDNDNRPRFRQDSYNFTISESAIYPFTVGYVKAEDDDSGSFREVVYSLSGQGASDFLIFPSGLILVNLSANLDFETKTVYKLLVTASDNPTNQTSTVRLQTSVPLQINIRDENDNTPVFADSPGPFYVVETARVGTNIGKVVATDRDTGTNGDVYFSIRDPSGLFRINAGFILTRRNLTDMSPLSPFVVTVRAEDGGTPSRYSEVDVQIFVRSGQLDDGRPQWSIPRLGEPYYVVENTPEVQFVVQARATAKFLLPDVTYSFSTESDDYKMFNIDPITGNVTTNGIFDWETQNIYSLILVATDAYNSSLQSLRGLTVRVIDVDDNVPDFGKCPGVALEVPWRVTVPEDIPVNSSIYQVRACDLDQSVNSVIYREETGNAMCDAEREKGYFAVSLEGEITLRRPLDREIQQYHLVCVRAFPGSNKRRKRQADQFDGFDRDQMDDPNHVAYVVIQVSDRNDNGPVFPYLFKRLFQAIATVPNEKAVVRVEAIDPDLPPFNRVQYSITNIMYHEPEYPSYPLPGAFLIGPDTGIVSVNFPSYSDFRIPFSYFNITIEARDFREATLFDVMNLYVYIFEPSQTLRVVINKTPDSAKSDVDEMMRLLAEADPDSIFELQQVSYHRVVDDFDVTKTDVCFVVVRNNKVLSVREGTDTLRQRSVEEVLNQYGATSPGSCYRSRSSLDKIDWAPLWWVLVALAIFIFICCVILIVAIYILYGNYKNYMQTRKTYLVPQ